MNKLSKARIEANNRYNLKAYDRINIAVKKGKKETIKNRAEQQNKSINTYINDLIEKDLEQFKP